jgi:CheY-like chemotaxis protein
MARGGSEPLAGRRVLIVEDRYLIAIEMADHVGRLGGKVVGPSRDVAGAEALLAGERVDVAVLDVNLDGELVFPLAERLAGAGVPFIFLTGYDGQTLPPAWQDRPRFAKPVNARALCDELVRLSRPLG